MLNLDALKTQIKNGLTEIYKPAVKQVILDLFVQRTEYGDELAEEISTTFDEITAEPFAELLSAAIDYYVRNISLSGTVITVGSPTTQTAYIAPASSPQIAGKIPNTLGIS